MYHNYQFDRQGADLTHSPINHFETVPNSQKLQTPTEIRLLKDFEIQITKKTLWKKVKLLSLSNFTFFQNVFLSFFFLQCVKMNIYGGKGYRIHPLLIFMSLCTYQLLEYF